MYSYHADIVWQANAALLVMIIIISITIFACSLFKDLLWKRRRHALRNLKNNVYEIILAHKTASQAACESFIVDLTPQQFIDIETNRNIRAAFFNNSEQQFFRSCSIRPEMLSKLKKTARASRNKWRRIEALIALGYTQTNSAMRTLKVSLSDKDKDVAYYSMVSLGQIKNAQSARTLLELLQKDPSNAYRIVSILENFPEEVSDEVIKLTYYYDPLVKYWALVLLSKLNSSSHVARVEELTQDHAAEVRAAGCDCLGRGINKDAAPALIRCMKDDSWLVRRHAVLAFEKVMGDAALPEVIKHINDASWSVLDAIKEVMANHIEASLPYIERFLDGEDEIAKKYSVIALDNSGYLVKLLNDAVSGGNKDSSIRLLKGVIRSRVSFSLDSAIRRLDPAIRGRVIDVLERLEKA